MRSSLSFLVIGCGSIGRRHITNLKSLGIENISAYDIDETRLKQIKTDQQVRVYTTLEECFKNKRIETIKIRLEKLDAIKEADSAGIEVERSRIEQCKI